MNGVESELLMVSVLSRGHCRSIVTLGWKKGPQARAMSDGASLGGWQSGWRWFVYICVCARSGERSVEDGVWY